MFAEKQEIERFAAEGRLIDVRTAAEYRAFHIPGAVNLPLDQFSIHSARLAAMPGTLVLTCHSGKRAEQAMKLLQSCQKVDVKLVPGGTDGWRTSGGAVLEGREAMSLERQVRIVAGGLAATGAGLGLLVNPLFGIVPLAIGTGLVVAGVTDTCMMGMLLAKMPWNRDRDSDPKAIVTRLEMTCSS